MKLNLSDCLSPIVAIQPTENHLIFHPNEDLFFTATIQWACPLIPYHRFQWLLVSISSQQFPSAVPIVTKDSVEFYLSSKNLLDDHYLLHFTIDVNGTTRPISFISDIKIKSSNILLKLIEDSATHIDHFIERSLLLNPARYLNEPQVI